MKKGFTLAEVMCAMVIVGILMVYALNTMRPTHKAVKYQYSNAYSSLSKAYYNAMINGFNPFAEKDSDGNDINHTASSDDGTLILCKGLTSFINTTTNSKTAEGDYSTSCSKTKVTNELANSFSDENVQFTATNGMKFYISNMIKNDSVDGDRLKFYLVFVDVNGKRKPNSFKYTGDNNSIEPDIFAFALMDTGRVVPIGIPEYDVNIASARYAYASAEGELVYSKVPLPLYKAKCAAWGFYCTDRDENGYNPSEPFTANDIIRRNINKDSEIVKKFPNLTKLSKQDKVDVTNHCSNVDLESCYVFIDEYRAN